jgi:hypothetical protein
MDDSTDPLDGLGIDSTDTTDGDTVTQLADNPSNGLSASDLLSQLIGTAGAVAVANQTPQVVTTVAQPGTTVIPGIGTISNTTLIVAVVGVIAFALILRK